MIESVELSIWLDNGTYSEIELSPMQTLMILKILGIKPQTDTYISCYSDETLKSFLTMKANPLKLKEVEPDA